jgi:glycosyltransferase 2 family protein
VVATCLWLAFRDVSIAAAAQLLAEAGPALVLVPVPFLFAQLADAKACQLLFGRMEPAPPFAHMFQSQVAGEASTLALPMGFLVGESLRPWLLARGNSARLASSIAAVTGRKCLLIAAEGGWMLLALLLAPSLVSQLSQRLVGGPWLIVATLVLATVLLGIGWVMASFFGGGSVASRLFQRLTRSLPGRLGARVARGEAQFARTDSQLQRVFSRPLSALVVPGLLYLSVWVLEGLEVWLILRLLHVDVALTTAFYIEAVVASCRFLLPLTPAGLGVQDAGYVAFFAALGLPGALGVGAAFCMIKRSRELLWCLLGATCWVLARRAVVPARSVTASVPGGLPATIVAVGISSPPDT